MKAGVQPVYAVETASARTTGFATADSGAAGVADAAADCGSALSIEAATFGVNPLISPFFAIAFALLLSACGTPGEVPGACL